MATLRLKGSDPIAPTLRLLASGTVSAEDWEAMVGAWSPSGTYGKPLEEYSLRHYGELTACTDDIAAVTCHLRSTRLRTVSDIGDVTTAEFLDCLKGLREDMERIKREFDNLPRPALTSEEVEAGFGRLDYGLFGVVDELACRQGLTDEQVKDMSLRTVLGKLAIIGGRAQAERRLADIRARKTRRRL